MKKNQFKHTIITTVCALIALTNTVCARAINQWKNDQKVGQWEDGSMWKLNHPPKRSERIQIRTSEATITINEYVAVNQGIQLYGEHLYLKGTGKIDLINPVIHNKTIDIPASCDGSSTLTITDQVSINARILLSGKTYGTSPCKGTLILKDQSRITGALCIGHDGAGVGMVILGDQSTFHITDINLQTDRDKGGKANLHVMSGTLWITLSDKSARTFLNDPSQQIVVGNKGTLILQSSQTTDQKSAMIRNLIRRHRIVTYSGSTLDIPVILDDKISVRTTDYIPQENASAMTDDNMENANKKPSSKKMILYTLIFVTTLPLVFISKKFINTSNDED